MNINYQPRTWILVDNEFVCEHEDYEIRDFEEDGVIHCVQCGKQGWLIDDWFCDGIDGHMVKEVEWS